MKPTVKLHPINEASFSTEISNLPDGLKVAMVGTADTSVREALDKFLTDLHRECCRLTSKRVVIDLRELEFMNSSCFKSFLTWIGRIQQLDDKSRYTIKLLSDPDKYWQRRSLHALRCFATDLIEVEG